MNIFINYFYIEFEKLVKEMMENFADFIALYPAHYAGNSGD